MDPASRFCQHSSAPTSYSGWNTFYSELSSPGARLPFPPRLLHIHSSYFGCLPLFLPFALLAAATGSPPFPSPVYFHGSDHVHSGLPQMSLPLAMLFHISILNFLLHDTWDQSCLFPFLFLDSFTGPPPFSGAANCQCWRVSSLPLCDLFPF